MWTPVESVTEGFRRSAERARPISERTIGADLARPAAGTSSGRVLRHRQTGSRDRELSANAPAAGALMDTRLQLE